MSEHWADELDWRELREGDRVDHFDYGLGTIRAAALSGIYISWDDPRSMRATNDGCHVREITYYLRRVDPDAPADAPVLRGAVSDEAQEHEVLVTNAIRARVLWWLRTNGFPHMEDHRNRQVTRLMLQVTDKQWELFEDWLDVQPRP